MSLSFIDWETSGVTVLNLSGALTLGAGTRVFRQLIEDAITLGKKKVILNMAEVFRIDSTGLGELVTAHIRMLRAGGKLKLIRLPQRTHELVQLTRLHSVFEFFNDEESAVKSFLEETGGEGIPREPD